MRGMIALCLFTLGAAACSAGQGSTPAASRAVIAPVTVPPTSLAAQAAATAAPALATSPAKQSKFDGKQAYEYVLKQMDFGAHPAGSVAIRKTGDYILEQLKSSGWETEVQEFTYRGIPIRNIIAKAGVGRGPLVLVGAHYDTRPRADQDKLNPNMPVPGANDGASGAAVLLELARALDKSALKNEVWLAFFDAEDNGKLDACALNVTTMQAPQATCDTTPWQWSVGAEHVADNLTTTPAAVVVLDMIGDADQNIYYEHNSDEQLQKTLWQIAGELGYGRWLIPEFKWTMTDDHTPFIQKGIRAVDMIDFDYPPWHTTKDTADKVSADSLERVGRTIQAWLESGAPIQ